MSSPTPKRSRWRRFFVRGLGLGAVLLAIAFIYRNSILRTAILQAAEAAGQELSFNELQTDFWSSLELSHVQLRSMTQSADQTHFEAEAVRVEFSLSELVRDGLTGVHAIRIRNVEGDLYLGAAQESSAPATSSTELPASLPVIELGVQRLGVHLPGSKPIQLQELQLESDPASPSDLELRIERVLYDERAAAVYANLRYQAGRVELDTLQVGAQASISGFLEQNANGVAWNLDVSLGSGRLTSTGSETASARVVDLQCLGLSLTELAAFGREPKEDDATGLLHASLHAEDAGSSLFPAFNGELELLQIEAADYGVDRLTASLHTEEAGQVSWNELKGNALLKANGLHIPGAHLEDLDADVRFDGTHFTLESLSSQGALHEFKARGELTLDSSRTTVALEQFTLQHDVTDLALVTPTTLILEQGRPSELTIFGFEGTAGQALVVFDPTTPGCVDIQLKDLSSNGLLSAMSMDLPEVEGLEGTVQACRTREGWTGISTDLAVRRLRFEAAEFDCSARVQCAWTNSRLEFERVSLHRNEVTLLEGAGSIGLDEGGLVYEAPLEVNLSANIPRVREQVPKRWRSSCPANADVDLEVKLTGTLDSPRGHLNAGLENMALLARNDPTRSFLPPTALSLKMTLADEVVLESLQWTGGQNNQLHASGNLQLPQAHTDTREEFIQQLKTARLRGTGAIATETLDEVSDWLRDWFEFSSNVRSGILDATFEVAGTLGSPEFKSDFELNNGTVRTAGIPPINQVHASGHYEGNRLALSAITGELGAAPFTAEATVDFTEASPTIEAALRGEELLLVRNSSTKVRADLDLALAGPLESLLLSGSVTLAQGRLVSPLEILDFNLKGQKPARREGLFLFRLADEPLKSMRFDVDLRAHEGFEIDNNVATGSVRPDLHLSGTGEVPTLSGTLYIDETLVRLPANNISVNNGSLRFDEADPFFPRIEISADARIKGYDVLITVAGPYDQPEVRLSSAPPLPDEDLILLVLAGQLPGTSASRTGRAAAQSVAVYLAKDYLTRWLSSADPEDEGSWVDRFDFQTGRDISRSGAETLEASFRIDENRFGERDVLYLTAESDQYDFVNFGLRLVFHFQ